MLTGVQEIAIDTYEQMLDVSFQCGGNLLAIGQAGIGKTEIPYQRAAKLGIDVIYWNLSTQEAPDLVGLPIIKLDGGVEVVRYAVPEYMPILERTQKPVIVVVDEVDKAKAELQNPLLEILQSTERGEGGRLNGRKLNIQSIVMTGNLPDEGAFSKPISMALTNRGMVYKLVTDFDKWRDWAVGADVNPLITGFLSRNTDLHSMKPVVGDPTAYVRASPRSWVNGARNLDKILGLQKAGKLSFKSLEEEMAFHTVALSGSVGTAAAVQFRVWLQFFRKIEPKVEMLVRTGKLPSEDEIEKMESAETIVFSIASTRAIIDAQKAANDPDASKKEVHRVAHNVAQLLKIIPSEYQVAAIKSTLSPDYVKSMELTKVADLMKVYKNVRQVTKDAA